MPFFIKFIEKNERIAYGVCILNMAFAKFSLFLLVSLTPASDVRDFFAIDQQESVFSEFLFTALVGNLLLKNRCVDEGKRDELYLILTFISIESDI